MTSATGGVGTEVGESVGWQAGAARQSVSAQSTKPSRSLSIHGEVYDRTTAVHDPRKDGDGDGEEGDLEMAWPPRDKLRSGAHGGQPPKVTLHDGSVHAAPSNMKTPPRRDHGRTTYFEV